jgi:hypothetical protein
MLGFNGDVEGEGQMATQGDAQGQQAGCERRGVIPIAPADVSHGPRRHAGRDRDLAHRGAPDAGRDDPSERVDAVKAAMQDAVGKRAACACTPPTAQPRDPDRGALRSLTQLPPIAAPPDHPAATGPATPSLRPGLLLRVAT